MSPKKQFPEFNYQLLHHVKLVKIFQQYCHLHFAGNISKWDILMKKWNKLLHCFEQVFTCSDTTLACKCLLIVININSKLMC